MGHGGPCMHCGSTTSPCWRRGPAEKPLLCNACGAHYLSKHSLAGYMPKLSVRSAASESHLLPQAAKQQLRQSQHHALSRSGGKRMWQQAHSSSGASSMDRQEGDDLADTAAECSSKRPRLVACRVYEIDPHTATALRLLKTFETADGVVLTVIRRPRKQAKPRACAVA